MSATDDTYFRLRPQSNGPIRRSGVTQEPRYDMSPTYIGPPRERDGACRNLPPVPRPDSLVIDGVVYFNPWGRLSWMPMISIKLDDEDCMGDGCWVCHTDIRPPREGYLGGQRIPWDPTITF